MHSAKSAASIIYLIYNPVTCNFYYNSSYKYSPCNSDKDFTDSTHIEKASAY